MMNNLQSRSSRETQLTSRIIFIASISIQLYWCIKVILQSEYYYDILLLPVGIYLSIFFVNSFITNIVCILVPTGWLCENSEYCSNVPKEPVICRVCKVFRYPSLTIQIPVYTESFETVIQPTLLQAIEACQQYAINTGAKAGLFVNDDGLDFISEKERSIRIHFYKLHGISFSRRPVQGRRGKFKKAGNLNYCLNHEHAGDIILLLDSDSRIPTSLEKAVCEFSDSDLGFLQMQTHTNFSGKPSLWELVVGHFTNNINDISFHVICAFGDPAPLIGHNVFIRKIALEHCAKYDHTKVPLNSTIYSGTFTQSVNNAEDIIITDDIVCEMKNNDIICTFKKEDIVCIFNEDGSVATHKKETMPINEESAKTTYNEPVKDKIEQYGFQYFSEEHVSEDFELSMRLQTAGYKGRYATYLAGFKEGVTLTTVDEITRLQKYAYGVNELILHPFRNWCSHGLLGSTFKSYILSANVPFSTKYNTIGYIGIYYALAFSPIAVTINYVAYHYFPTWSNLYISSEQILYACVITFLVITPIATIILKKKLTLQCSILKEIGYSVLLGLFFSGIGFPILISLFAHFFGTNMSWSTTNKETSSRFIRLKEIWQTCRLSIIWAFLQLMLVILGWFFLNIRKWQSIVPIALSASAHLIVPFISIF
jgi:cellulose synthase/poly-beta-1,6-N-acetylglucosamine synthase-like glycosyltransferase